MSLQKKKRKLVKDLGGKTLWILEKAIAKSLSVIG